MPVSMSKIGPSDKEAIREDREKWWNNFYSKVGLHQYFLNQSFPEDLHNSKNLSFLSFHLSKFHLQYEKLSEVAEETVGIEEIDDANMLMDREDDLG